MTSSNLYFVWSIKWIARYFPCRELFLFLLIWVLLRGDDIFLENWFDDHLIVELFLFAYKNNLIISSGPLYDREILEFNRTKFVLGPNFLIIVHFPSLQHSCYASLSNRSLYVCLNPLWATFHGPNHTSYRPNNTCNLQISFWVCSMNSM